MLNVKNIEIVSCESCETAWAMQLVGLVLDWSRNMQSAVCSLGRDQLPT